MSYHISSKLTISNCLKSPSPSIDSIDSWQAKTLLHALYEKLLFGGYRSKAFTDTEYTLSNEYGVGRHKQSEAIDEPLAILAALH